jgi:hypothetical protein
LFRKTHHPRGLQDCADRDLAWDIQLLLQCTHRFVIRAGQLGVERQVARAVRATVESNCGIGPAARDIFIDRLANARFEFGQVPRQINYNIALLSIH